MSGGAGGAVAGEAEVTRVVQAGAAVDRVASTEGMRSQRLVFIGLEMEANQGAIEAALDSCLLQDHEMELYGLTDDSQRRDNFPGLDGLLYWEGGGLSRAGAQ